MAATPARLGAGFAIYVALGGVLLVFGILSGFSIGLFILPVPIVMFLALPFWSRRWLVAGLVAAVAAGSLVYLGTIPLSCSVAVQAAGGETREVRRGCTRWWLSDTAGLDTRRAEALALRSALASGLGAGLVAASLAWVLSRPRRP